MKCIICDEQIYPEERFWSVKEEAAHQECCDFIEKGLRIREIKFEQQDNMQKSFE
jgi:hypothetical protein